MQIGTSYRPQVLEGMDHAKVKAALANPLSPVGKEMKTEIDNITALVCKSISGAAGVCNSDSIKSLSEKI